QPERLLQVGSHRAGQHHPVAGGLFDADAQQLDQAGLDLLAVPVVGGAHGWAPPGGCWPRRASARSRWIMVRVRSLRVRSMIERATSVERRRLPVMASGESRRARGGG